ncbi:hypothetical protein SKAU_G00335690 [Synaphobranchus kaupii]|uniref:Uncharacterized protein n=1 Tax=Synaphobranchus kaupii TaxID=118154 RepID=A0A9Q1IGR8_SYNKA|nr:hypothetical protein SKAU_G00335690 [Synaphobranchus kaupii]
MTSHSREAPPLAQTLPNAMVGNERKHCSLTDDAHSHSVPLHNSVTLTNVIHDPALLKRLKSPFATINLPVPNRPYKQGENCDGVARHPSAMNQDEDPQEPVFPDTKPGAARLLRTPLSSKCTE